jgi:murein DD-endopeptidase MepM/ murein hydrolase activator NlpD
MSEMDRFLEEVGGLETKKIVFRPGAPTTCSFGLVERHRLIEVQDNGSKRTIDEWGWPDVHFGADRGPSPISYRGYYNGIFAPVAAERSAFENWHGKVYGTLIFLYHWSGFAVVIAHCDPNEIDILPTLQREGPIEAGEYLAPIGDNGYSRGKHSHTEIRSEDEDTPVLEEMLRRKYGDEANRELTEEQVVAVYRSSRRTADKSPEWIADDYAEIRKRVGVIFLNAMKLKRQKGSRILTYYSSALALDF